jgi:AcrR family transcriptional regulator
VAAQKKSDNEPRVSLWERLERPAAAPRPSLTPHQIAAAAVEIADAEGLDAVTMRRLASTLGVAPMAAYRYVSGKGDVLELMVDMVYGELELPEAAGWRETLWALATRTRALILKHRWLGQLVAAQTVFALTPNLMAVAERSLAALGELSTDADTKMAVFRTVDSYVQGAANAEIAQLRLMEGHGWSSGHQMRDGLAPQMVWLLNTGRYPTFQRYIREGARKDDPQWQFEIGLDCVLDGIAARMFGISHDAGKSG